MTFPDGKSPKVFTEGWLFGAKCILHQGTEKEQDFSEFVTWSGSGSFEPEIGARCRPVFNNEGQNSITLTCTANEKRLQKTFIVQTVSSSEYAHVGSLAYCANDSHGCDACPHSVIGPIMSGSSLISIHGKLAARVGDPGVHAACYGPNTFEIIEGDPEVLIEGRRAARYGDQTQHCGGIGRIVHRAPDTM